MRRLTANIFLSALYRATVLLTGLIVQQRILKVFGSDVNGLTSGIAQLLSFLALIEAGIGAAAIQALHRPLRDGDDSAASALLSASKRLYIRVGLCFLVGLLMLTAVLTFALSDQLEPKLIAAVTVISGLGTVLSYTFTAKYTVLLLSDGRSGVIYATDTALTLLACAIKLTAAACAGNAISYTAVLVIQAAPILTSLLKCLILGIYIRKRYPSLTFSAAPSDTFADNRRSALVHQVTGTVATHVDITLLTLFSSLKTVSVYSVYNYVYSALSAVLNTVFSQSVLGHFGKSAAGTAEEYRRHYLRFEAIYTAVLYYVLTLALALTLPFVRLYTSAVTDIAYADTALAVLFFLTTLASLIKLPMTVTVTAYGHFRETQRGAIIECAINLALSALLLPFLGIYGLLIGTLCSYIFRAQDVIRYTYKTFGFSYAALLRANIGNIIASAAVLISALVLFPISALDWWDWVLKAIITAVISAMCFALADLAVDRKLFISLVRDRHRI